LLLDGEDADVAVDEAGADEAEDGAVAGVPASFFEADPESEVSPDGGFILLE
jgi:hypothetical protein